MVLALKKKNTEAIHSPHSLHFQHSPISAGGDPSHSNFITYNPDPITFSSPSTVVWGSEVETTVESVTTETTTLSTTDWSLSFASSVRWSGSSTVPTAIPVPFSSVSSREISTISVFPSTSRFLTFTSTTTPIPTTTTTYVPTTITPPPNPPPNPCPTTCSISAGTVNLFYWPSDDHVYPSTYVNTHLNWTFHSTSPSVYMVIDNIYGYNTAGRAGPSGTSVVFPLDLDQVSTIIPEESITRQLTLSDLGTDCPQTEAESVIATAAPNGRCDPILAAPKPVKSWASPCNACGNFGLFDPPYAVAPLTGGLVPETTTSMTQPEITTTTSTSSQVDETTTPTDDTTTFILETSQATSEVTSSSNAPSSSSEISFSSSEASSPTTTAETVDTFLATDTVSSDTMSSTIPSSLSTASELIHSSSSSPSASMSTPATAAGTKKMVGGLACWISCFVASVLLL
ncbi:hypothetical protein N7452_000106 [Penicillium brevicompactum]|uniref:Uncharacterized protein n=1 Tax=Penicillium brevicompactum TaxID=5074 RepID=A0A9W9UNA3_PENBR|nr:hypothetical protein N7452_000106 [Penicillium brevicompactum]